MGRGPSLVMRGVLCGCILLVIFGFWVTSGVAPSQAAPNGLSTIQAPATTASDDQAIQVEVRNGSNPGASCMLSQNYPAEILQWCEYITHYSGEQQLDANLIAALIWQESGGNSGAYSKSGAVGLMQVMPRDGIAAGFMCKNGPCFSKRPSIEELRDPEFNIKYGTKMLARLVNYHGSLREALKSYGPMDAGYSYADKVLGIFNRYGE